MNIYQTLRERNLNIHIHWNKYNLKYKYFRPENPLFQVSQFLFRNFPVLSETQIKLKNIYVTFFWVLC